LQRGTHPMPATLAVVIGCVGVWIASIATGGSVWNGSVHGSVDHDLARNAVSIGSGQWWRVFSYGTLNLSLFAFVVTMALLLLAGMQVERTYGTIRFLAVLVAAWTTGALAGLLVEPAHALNAGTSGATFGVAAAATIDLLRRGVPWYRTFWIPTVGIILVLGFIFPTSVTWGAHMGGIIAGALVGTVASDPREPTARRHLVWVIGLAVLITTISLLAVPYVARHTVSHGPILVGGPTVGRQP
jgi:membrane associated rhomboid family serine protease